MLSLVVFQHDLHGQYLPQSEEKLPLRNVLSLKIKKEVVVHSHGIARDTCILRCNNQAIELQLLPLLYPVNAVSQMRTTWS